MHYQSTEQLDDESFIRKFEERVQQTIEEFGLFTKHDKLFVAASGGKDSTVLLYLMKKLGYSVEAITVNAHIGCYSDQSLEHLRNFCTKEEIPLHTITLQEEFGHSLCTIMALMDSKGFNKTSCSICGALRRYLLNKHGRKLGAKILLTGHNLDDESEAIMMALFAGNLKHVARVGPVTRNKTFISRAKPLYFISEDEVIRYSKIKQFDVHYGWCPCSVKASRRFYAELELNHEKKFNLAKNILMHSVQLKNYFKSEQPLKLCSLCEEPSSNEICQTCTILNTIKDMPAKRTIAVVEGATCES